MNCNDIDSLTKERSLIANNSRGKVIDDISDEVNAEIASLEAISSNDNTYFNINEKRPKKYNYDYVRQLFQQYLSNESIGVLVVFLAITAVLIGKTSQNTEFNIADGANLLSMFGLSGSTNSLTTQMSFSDILQTHVKPQTYILGGTPAKKPYPFMVGISYSGFVGCGGSLISPSVVLSAAHCDVESFGFEVKPTHVLINCKTRFYDPEEKGCERIRVESVTKHPKYNQNTIKYDIMVVILKKKAKAKPVSILNHELQANRTVKTLGYGIKGRYGAPSIVLKEAHLKVTERKSCNKMYRQALATIYRTPVKTTKSELIDKSMVCAAGKTGSVSKGDSGGPILKVCDSGEYYQGGVTSFGLSFIYETLPDVFANVAAPEVLDFLKRNVRAQGQSLSIGNC